jgi:hypothetical protein
MGFVRTKVLYLVDRATNIRIANQNWVYMRYGVADIN